MKVLILGGGLSAAFAWRACLDNGITPDVIAERLFVPPGGFVFVHWLPRSVNKPDLWESIEVSSVGTEKEYVSKTWHTAKEMKTSFPKEPYHVRGASPIKAARALWGTKENIVTSLRIMKITEEEIKEISSKYDVIVRTFPVTTQKREYHTPIWVIPLKNPENSVLYDGTYATFWLRRSQLFHFCSYEFPPVIAEITSHLAERFGEVHGLTSVKNAKIWYAPEIEPSELRFSPHTIEDRDGKTLYCGRFGMNSRKTLSHETYQRVVLFLKEKGYERPTEGSRTRDFAAQSLGSSAEL